MQTDLYKLAGEAYDAFRLTDPDRGERPDIIILRGDAPEWVHDLAREAHGDLFPDDWRYASIRSALGAIHDSEPDNLDEYAHEWADRNVDTYNGSRTAWLASNLSRAGYCDDATDEFGPAESIFDAIGRGQYMESLELYAAVAQALRDRADALES